VLGAFGRQVFEGGDRPFELDVALLTGSGYAPVNFVHLARPFQCTCCCFARPEVHVSNSLTGMPIGKIIDPFACCNFTITVKDNSDNDVLKLSKSPFDCAMCCWGCPCGCQEIEFQITDANSGDHVGSFRKQFRAADAIAMATGLNMDGDTYVVDFKKVSNPEWKAMLIAVAVFFDFRFFTTGGQTGRDQSLAGQLLAD